MKIIFAKDVEVYSFPLGKDLVSGYEDLVRRVCNVSTKRGSWTGVLIGDTVLTSGFLDHNKEFDVQFYKQPKTSGFFMRDFGDIIEIGIDKIPEVGMLGGLMKPPPVGKMLYVIGNFFGKPFEIATCKVEMVGNLQNFDAVKPELVDLHTCGSPVFTSDGFLAGIVDCYVPKQDRIIIRSLTANEQGRLQ